MIKSMLLSIGLLLMAGIAAADDSPIYVNICKTSFTQSEIEELIALPDK